MKVRHSRQEIAIAQNKTLKVMYQTWWVQWLARVVMVGFIIYMLLNNMDSTAALFGVFLAIFFWGVAVKYRAANCDTSCASANLA
jgi:hypothetical protein